MAEFVLSRSRVLRLAVPVMLAQAAIAATGVVDTAVMGLYGDKSDLAAVAVAVDALRRVVRISFVWDDGR